MESLQGVHHFYIGLILALLGFFLLWASRPWMAAAGIVLSLLGALVMLDDFWQHFAERFIQPGYESPLKRLYCACDRNFPLIGKITGFVDAVFRGRRPF